MVKAHLKNADEQNGNLTGAADANSPDMAPELSDDDSVYADAGHWMHSISADDTEVAESGGKINLTDINLSAIVEEPSLPDKGTAHSLGRKLNIALCALAFIILFGYLFIAGEGEQTMNAFTSFNYAFLLLALVGIIVYWMLESLSMQLICDELFAGFSFIKTNIVTVIGQYFNCITPLSSGGQPMQAYYYSRFGLPVKFAMPMLLCRFIVYQLTMTVYAIIVLLLRFNYFTQDLRPIMYLVAIGFVGGFVLIAMLFSLAFAKNAIIKATRWCITLLGRIGIVKKPEETLTNATNSLEEAYVGIRFLLKRPAVLTKVSLVTFVQLTVYFSLSWVIFAGFGLEANDYFTVVSCQAFVYLIASFVPLPGAVGAAEGSYIVFFNYVYGDASIVALSTFIWRMFTFYLPIILGMILTLMVNNEKSFLARWLRRDDVRMAFTDHTVIPKEKRKKKKKKKGEEAEDEASETADGVAGAAVAVGEAVAGAASAVGEAVADVADTVGEAVGGVADAAAVDDAGAAGDAASTADAADDGAGAAGAAAVDDAGAAGDDAVDAADAAGDAASAAGATDAAGDGGDSASDAADDTAGATETNSAANSDVPDDVDEADTASDGKTETSKVADDASAAALAEELTANKAASIA